MTELQLYRYINDNNIEYHNYKNKNDKDDVLIFVYHNDIADFCNILGHNIFDDNTIDVILKHDYICLWMRDICEYNDIELQNVFEKDQ